MNPNVELSKTNRENIKRTKARLDLLKKKWKN
jgi:hypothetical protein